MSSKKNTKPRVDESIYSSANTSVIEIDSSHDPSVIVLDDSVMPLDNSSFDSTYLAGGDSNSNPMQSFNTPRKVLGDSNDFIKNEMVTSTPAHPPAKPKKQPLSVSGKPPMSPVREVKPPSTPESNGKRKRARSPDSHSEQDDEAFDEREFSNEETAVDIPNKNSISRSSNASSEHTTDTVVDMTSGRPAANVSETGDKTESNLEKNVPGKTIPEKSLPGKSPEKTEGKNPGEELGPYDEYTRMNLPSTVTLLTTPTGARVYVVGTAHFSQESQEDVAKMIQAVRPHIVCVELCKTRTNILQLDEKTILEEAKNINLDKIRMSIHQMGLVNGLMYILLLNMSAHLTKELGMAPGGEFRRAINEVKALGSDCMIHLGDRPLNVTIQRALRSLTWWQTLKLSWHLIMNKDPISKEEVERCKQRDLLEEMLKEMAGEFPQLGMVFVQERDIYLSYSLQLAAMSEVDTQEGGTRVVGVVGIGHVPGIVHNWGKVTVEDIVPLMHIPPPSRSSVALKLAVKASLVGLAVWAVARYAPRPDLSRFVKLR